MTLPPSSSRGQVHFGRQPATSPADLLAGPASAVSGPAAERCGISGHAGDLLASGAAYVETLLVPQAKADDRLREADRRPDTIDHRTPSSVVMASSRPAMPAQPRQMTSA